MANFSKYGTQSINDLTPPMHRSASFKVPAQGTGFAADTYDSKSQYFYSRWANPTVRELEMELAKLEGGDEALCFASGMAAITGLLFGLLGQGDHLIAQNVCYPGVPEFLHQTMSRFGVEISFVNTSDTEAVLAAIKPNTKVILIETPANPILRLADIEALSTIAKNAGAKLIVDSTFASPVITKPLELGADFVIHSLTKYIGGHGDALGGVVIGKRDAIDHLRREILIHCGAIMDPFPAWLFLRSLVTLVPRVEKHCQNAQAMAQFLEDHPRIIQVNYPGLKSHPQYELAERQMKLPGGMIAFQAKQPEALAEKIAETSKVFGYAVSLGKPTSLIFYSPTKDINESCFQLSANELKKYKDWAGEGVFRFSVGLEHPVFLCEELERLLS